MFFGTLCKTIQSPFNNKGAELGAIYFGKYSIYISKTTISDPAFLSIQDIVLTIIAEFGSGFCSEGVTATVRFSKTISRFPFAGSQLRYVFLFLFFRSEEIGRASCRERV